MWTMAWTLLGGRPAVCAAALSAGIYDLAVATLRASGPPSAWLSVSEPAGFQAAAISLVLLQTVATGSAGMDVLSLAIESGVADAFVAAIQAFELRGVGKLSDTNKWGLHSFVMLLDNLDLVAPEAAPLVAMLQKIPTALTFTVENNLPLVRSFGLSTRAQCAVRTKLCRPLLPINLADAHYVTTQTICAKLFGNGEGDDAFVFTAELVDEFLLFCQQGFSGELKQFIQVLLGFLSGVVQLCKSDHNKSLLIQSPNVQYARY